jgi:hypothetical protein
LHEIPLVIFPSRHGWLLGHQIAELANAVPHGQPVSRMSGLLTYTGECLLGTLHRSAFASSVSDGARVIPRPSPLQSNFNERNFIWNN